MVCGGSSQRIDMGLAAGAHEVPKQALSRSGGRVRGGSDALGVLELGATIE